MNNNLTPQTAYPYRGAGDDSTLGVVGNWCSAGGRNPGPLIKDYLQVMTPKRLAAVIKASWKVPHTLAELETAAKFYRDTVLNQ